MSELHENPKSGAHTGVEASNPRRAAFFMIAFALSWAIVEMVGGPSLIKYSPFQVIFTRYVVHLVILFALVGFRAPRLLVRTRRPLFQWSRSLLMVCMPASFVFALRGGVDLLALLTMFWGLTPLLVVMGGYLLLRERPAPFAILATLAATGGTLLLFITRRLPPWPLLLLPVGMAASFSLYVVMTRSLRSEQVRSNLFYTAAGVALTLAPFMPSLWITPTPWDLLAMIGVGLFGLLCLFTLDRATALAPLSTSAAFICLQAPFELALVYCVDHSRPRLRSLAGIAVVLAALLFIWLRAAPQSQPHGALQKRAP